MGSCQSKSTPQLGIHPNNSMNNGGGIKNMPPSKASTMIGTSGAGIANAIAGAHAAATAAVDHGRHDDDDIYDEDDEFESNYYEIKKSRKSNSSLMVDTNMDKNKKDRSLLLQPEDEVDNDDDGTGNDIPKVQIYTTRNNNSSRNSVFFSPVGEQTAATELPTPLSMADGEDNNYSHTTTTYSPPQSAIKSSRISINRHVSGRGHNIRSHDKAVKDDDNSVVRDEGFEVIRRLVDYDSPEQRGQAYGDVEEETTGLSIVPTSPVPSPTADEFHHPQEQGDDDEDDIMATTETDERSVSKSVLLSTTTKPVKTTLAASYCAYDYEIDCDDSGELPPLHIDDEAIKRIRERLSYLEDEEDDDSQSGDDGDEPKLSPDDEAIKRIRERLACLDDDDEEQGNGDNDEGRLLPVPARNNSLQLSEIQGDDSQSKISSDSPALVDPKRKNQASSTMLPYSPRPPTSKRPIVQAVDDEEEQEEDVANVNRLVDDLNRVSPLVAPPRDAVDSFLKDTTESQSSVDPKAIASFNKLKVQVELAAKADEKQKRDKKLQDRRADVNGYKNLWNDYQVIQEQMKETKINDTSRHTPSESLGAVSPQSQQQQEEKQQQQQQNRPGLCDGLLLHDPSTWFVDFRAMSALNHLYDDSDEDEGDDYTEDDSDEEDCDGRSSANGFSRHSSYTSRTSMSRLSHSDQMSQQQLFKRIAVERKRRSGAYSVGSTKGDVSHSLSANNRPSLSTNDDDEDKVGGNLSAEKSLSIKYTKSSINGVILPVVSPSGSDDIEVAFDEALEHDNETTPVNIEDQQREGSLLQNGTSMEDDGPVLNAPTPVASNQAVRPSFSPEYSLPSVKLSIDNNSTGEVRWRNFPVSDQPTTRRKLLFEDEDEVEAPKDEQEGRRQQKRDDDDEHADPLIDNEKARKQIAFLSADQFLRMAL